MQPSLSSGRVVSVEPGGCGTPRRLVLSRARCVVSALLAWAMLATPGCRRVEPLPPEALHDLASLDQFRAAFNRDVRHPRLIVLLSPT